MAHRRTDKQYWAAHGKRAVHLARMIDADHCLAQDNGMNIGGRQRVAERFQGLIRQGPDVSQSAPFHVVLPHAPPNKQENDARIILHPRGGLNERVEGMETMIAAVHHDERVFEPVSLPEEILVTRQRRSDPLGAATGGSV